MSSEKICINCFRGHRSGRCFSIWQERVVHFKYNKYNPKENYTLGGNPIDTRDLSVIIDESLKNVGSNVLKQYKCSNPTFQLMK